MKTTFTSNEIAHVWAHKQAPYGKSPGAMSFDGPCFYSYGTVIARHIEHKGKHAVILNDTSYSPTTTQHQLSVRQALSGETVFYAGGLRRGVSLDLSGKELFEYAVKQSADCLASAARAKSRKGLYEEYAARWLERAKEINAFYGLRRKVDEKTIERLRAASAEAERKAEVQRLAREARQRIDQQLAYDHWIHNEPCEYFNPSLFPVAFRVEGEELVSTRGARVPLADAKRALAFVLRHRESNWAKNGTRMPVGMYQLDSVTDGGVVAGCHRITWEEIERLQTIL